MQSTVVHRIKWQILLDMLNERTSVHMNEHVGNGKISVASAPVYTKNSRSGSNKNDDELINDNNDNIKHKMNYWETRFNDIVINVSIAHGLP